MQQVVEVQSPHGWWPEHKGPVVSYNFVYSDSLGVYYGMSGDGRVMEALERAARYHASFTYPDGSAAETVDGRNPYHGGVHLGNPGFSHTARGRGYLAQQHALHMEAGKSSDCLQSNTPTRWKQEHSLERSVDSRFPTALTRDLALLGRTG